MRTTGWNKVSNNRHKERSRWRVKRYDEKNKDTVSIEGKEVR